MSRFRLALLSLLLVAILPWGAFLSARAVMPAATGDVTVQTEARVAPHRCRTAILAGQCRGQDHVLSQHAELTRPNMTPLFRAATADVALRDGRHPRTPVPPPRRA